MRNWVLHKLWPEWPSSRWFLLEPCKAKPPLLAAVHGFGKSSGLSVQRDAGLGLGLSQELPYHPNMCSPQPREGKVCLQVRNKKFLLSEKYFSLGTGKKPGPLFVFWGKNPVFASFPLAADKIWLLPNPPQSAVLSPLWCFVLTWLCSSYSRQPRASPLPRPAFPLQDFFGEDACGCRFAGGPGMAWTGQPLFPCPAGSGWWQMDVRAQLMHMVWKFGLADIAGGKVRG